MKLPSLWLCLVVASSLVSLPVMAQDEPEESGELTDPFAPPPDELPPVDLGDDPGQDEPSELDEPPPGYTPRRRPTTRRAPRPLYEDEASQASTPQPKRTKGGMGVAPSAGVGLLLQFDEPQNNRTKKTAYSFPLWLGATVYPHLGNVTPFVNLNFGFDLTIGDVRTNVEYLPSARLGVAIIDGDPGKFENQLLPWFFGYFIAGARYVPGAEHEALRLGVGISSPAIVAATIYMCAQGVPIPNMIEYVIELDMVTRQPQHTLMFGIGL